MKCVFYTIVVALWIGAVISVPLSEEVDQVPPLPEPVNKDDGSADLKPPPPPPPQDLDNNASGNPQSAEASVFTPNVFHGPLPVGIPPFPDPYQGAYPPAYPLPYLPAGGYPTPYVVQTGYEGYLVPSPPAVTPLPPSDSMSFLRGLVPRSMLNWMTRTLALIVGTATVIFMGGAITTTLCSLTPLCSISFKSLPLFNWNDTARSVGQVIGKEITPERIKRTAYFVRTAIKKYGELQKAFAEDESTKKD